MLRRTGIAVCTVCVIAAQGWAQSGNRQISVIGTATVSIDAEILRLTMTVITQGETADEAYERAVRRKDDLISEFRLFGFGPDDYRTRYVVERRPLPGEKNKLGFLAAVGMSLVVEQFSAATRMLDVATQFGVRDLVSYFDITDRRSAYEKALRRALADARVKAEVLASESGIQLGSLAGFEELSQPPEEYVYPQPLLPPDPETLEEGQTPPAGTGSVRMAPQPYEIKARVRAAFAIGG